MGGYNLLTKCNSFADSFIIQIGDNNRPVPSRGKKCAGARPFAGHPAPPLFQH